MKICPCCKSALQFPAGVTIIRCHGCGRMLKRLARTAPSSAPPPAWVGPLPSNGSSDFTAMAIEEINMPSSPATLKPPDHVVDHGIQKQGELSSNSLDFPSGSILLRIVGTAVGSSGCLLLAAALNMNTTVANGMGSRVHNIGLMQEQLILVAVSLVMIVIGVAVALVGRR